jgi:A/G-specific adenine glycosylase
MCEGRINERWKSLPIKSKKIKKKDRYFLYFFDVKNGKTALTKRGKGDIWEAMFEMPLVELNNFQDELSNELKKYGKQLDDLEWDKPKKHVLTHQNIYYNFVRGFPHELMDEVQYYSSDEIEKLPLPRLLEKFIAQMP